MTNRTLDELINVCGGRAYNCNSLENLGIFVNNNKEVEKNCVYVAIQGQNYDGNDFAKVACDSGAAMVITEKKPREDLPSLVVSDLSRALIELAHYYRKKELSKVALVTGSVGKTTVKELLASILSVNGNVLKTQGNKNNTLGLPLTVLSNDGGADMAVLEAGISCIGEMDRLSYAACADVVVITNIGSMHAQSFKTLQTTANEKLKSIKYASKDRVCIIPYGEVLLDNVLGAIKVALSDSSADYWAENIVYDDKGSRFDLLRKNGERIKDIYVPICGEHGVIDALFACAAAFAMGADDMAVSKGLYGYKNDQLRQNIFEKNNITVMLDCYNSGPQSLDASINAFLLSCDLRQISKRNLLLGSMLELGQISADEHIKVGKQIAQKDIGRIITFGKEARNIALGALIGGFKGEITCFIEEQKEALEQHLGALSFDGEAVLIKGSRKLKMEELVPFVIKEE